MGNDHEEWLNSVTSAPPGFGMGALVYLSLKTSYSRWPCLPAFFSLDADISKCPRDMLWVRTWKTMWKPGSERNTESWTTKNFMARCYLLFCVSTYKSVLLLCRLRGFERPLSCQHCSTALTLSLNYTITLLCTVDPVIKYLKCLSTGSVFKNTIWFKPSPESHLHRQKMSLCFFFPFRLRFWEEKGPVICHIQL